MRVLAEVIAEHPLHVSAYGELAYVHALRGDADAVGRAIDTGLRELPRRWDSLYDYGGRAFERAGHLPRALHAYRKTLPAGPFHPGAERRGQIERLEQRIAHPAAPGG